MLRFFRKHHDHRIVYNRSSPCLRKKIVPGLRKKDSLSVPLQKANHVTDDERSQSRVWGRHSPTSI